VQTHKQGAPLNIVLLYTSYVTHEEVLQKSQRFLKLCFNFQRINLLHEEGVDEIIVFNHTIVHSGLLLNDVVDPTYEK